MHDLYRGLQDGLFKIDQTLTDCDLIAQAPKAKRMATSQPIEIPRDAKRLKTAPYPGAQYQQQPIQSPVYQTQFMHHSQSPEYYGQSFSPAPFQAPMPMQMQMQPFSQVGHPDVANFGGSPIPETGGAAHAAYQASGGHSRSMSHVSNGMSPGMGAISFDTLDDSKDFSQSGAGKKSKKQAEDHEDELKKLALKVKTQTLDELADSVRQTDNGPQAEKARQAFGMGW